MSTLFSSLIKEKCPRCRKGNLFITPFYHLLHFSKMHKECPHCQLRYEIEPGFFWAAMYVSYGLGIIICFAIGCILYWGFNDPSTFTYLFSILFVMLVLSPFLFRYSRVILLYFFSGVKYIAAK